jgi:hypothetical protein
VSGPAIAAVATQPANARARPGLALVREWGQIGCIGFGAVCAAASVQTVFLVAAPVAIAPCSSKTGRSAAQQP